MATDIWKIITENCQERDQFLRKKWFSSWEHYLNEDNNWVNGPCFEITSINENHCAVVPYAFQKIGPFLFASLGGNFFPHRGIPNSGCSRALIEKVVKEIEGINEIYGFRMGPVNNDDKFISSLLSVFYEQKWKVISIDIGKDFVIDLPNTEEKFLTSLKTSKKKKIGQRWRNINQAGVVEIVHYNLTSKEKWAEVFKQLASIEKSAWIANDGDVRFLGDSNQVFWNSLVSDDWYNNAINVWVLYFDNDPISFAITMDTQDMRYGYATSYNKKFSNYGTGIHLKKEVLLNTIKVGITKFNDGLGDTGYKSEFGAYENSTLKDIIAFPPTLKGRMAYYLAILKARI